MIGERMASSSSSGSSPKLGPPSRTCRIRRVGEDHDPRVEPRRVGERQVRGVDAVEDPLTASHGDGEQPEVELVDEVLLHQRAVELAGAELQDVSHRAAP